MEESQLISSNKDLSYRERQELDLKLNSIKSNTFVFGGAVEEKPKEITYTNYSFVSFTLLVPTDRPNGLSGKGAAHIPLTVTPSLAQTVLGLNAGDLIKVKGEARTKECLTKDGNKFNRISLCVKELKIA